MISLIDSKCCRKVTNMLTQETKERIAHKDGNDNKSSYVNKRSLGGTNKKLTNGKI